MVWVQREIVEGFEEKGVPIVYVKIILDICIMKREQV